MTPTVRPETAADLEAVRYVNRLAFGQDEEAGIVDALRDGGHVRVSLVAEVNGVVVGHILFSRLPILTNAGTVEAISLAPMAVLSEYQRKGIGSTLVEQGLEACRAAGHRIVVVLGHPEFYPRFGFSAKLAESLLSPFDGRAAWMATELVPGALDGVAGWVQYPPPFGIPEPSAGHRLQLLGVAGMFAVCKLPPGESLPTWAVAGDLFCVARTADELSVVCRQELVPEGVVNEAGWKCLRVAGAMPFTLVGVLAALTAPVARAGVGVFAFSTFDTDYLLVKAGDMRRVVAALRAAGHTVEGGDTPG